MFSRLLALARTIRISRTTKIYLLSWAAIALLSIVTFILAGYRGFTFAAPEASFIAVAVLILISLLFFSVFGRQSWIAPMIGFLALWLATRPVGFTFTYLLASLRLPLIDNTLERFDKALRFDWLIWYHYVNAHAGIKFILFAAYISMSLQILFSIIYFSHRRENHRNNEMWWTCAIALVITTIVSGILPAVGTFEYYGVVDTLHGVHLHDLHALRDGTLANFSADHMKGIITLPSYHTVVTILLIYIYRDQGRMLAIMLPLNVVQLVAIPSEGGHYLADIVAGGVVAVLAIWIVQHAGLGEKAASAPKQQPA